MNIELYDFEKKLVTVNNQPTNKIPSDEEINKKYVAGEARVITENGSIKLPLLNGMFKTANYILKPDYQRRLTWNNKKRSKLIESFIMNIPVPPVFLYETEFGVYQVMDGLQRISTIIAFFNNGFKLEGLLEWNELNGRSYDELPQKIKEGIERRQLSVITLLKESAKNSEQESNMKKMVFERLNTGGVKLEQQEVRNALYPGPFNNMCHELSENEIFRKLWGIEVSNMPNSSQLANIDDELEDSDVEADDIAVELDDISNKSNNKLFVRMFDIELVLRFFAMRNIENYNIQLSKFLDLYLENANKLSESNLEILRQKFITSMEKVNYLFGDKAFCRYVQNGEKSGWTNPQKMIYDPLMLAIESVDIDISNTSIERNITILKSMYENQGSKFNGKKQSKVDIEERVELFIAAIREITSA
ncbi:DUF262 domain-containing protein [Veillonella parvula]|uniref:DUF262 domain-containing protein n=1 Tax=Veillonella parvula TaxID=29466 RepID=UPI001896DB5D|nr:DUF262 domain-containing protein [Veillonella parvula]